MFWGNLVKLSEEFNGTVSSWVTWVRAELRILSLELGVLFLSWCYSNGILLLKKKSIPFLSQKESRPGRPRWYLRVSGKASSGNTHPAPISSSCFPRGSSLVAASDHTAFPTLSVFTGSHLILSWVGFRDCRGEGESKLSYDMKKVQFLEAMIKFKTPH